MDMDDIMSCKICMENFTDHIRPRTLKCGHSFCTRCLGNFISKGSLMCPMCQLPVEGKSALDFPVNFSMEEMISSLKLTQNVGAMGQSLTPPSGTANAPLLERDQGMSSLMHNLVLQHKENSKVLARDGKKIQSYLEKYRNYLDDKRREHEHFVVQLMELVDKNRQVIRQIEAERARVCCSQEQGVVCQNRLDGNLASLDVVLTSRDAASTIEELDKCCADLEKWSLTVQSQLPDSKVVACSEAVTEESKAAIEAAYVHLKDDLGGISSNALDFTHSPLSIIDKLHRCQGKPTIFVPNLKNKSEFLRRLLRNKRLYAVRQSKGKVRSAMLTFINNKVYLPCLREAEPPADAHTIDHQTLISSLNTDNVTAFLDLSWGGITRGRIHISLAPDTPLARNFRTLCTGDLEKSSYLHSRFLEVYKQGYVIDECIRAGDYETNTGLTGAVVVKGSDPKEAVYSRKIVTGMVWATHKDLDGPMTSQFSIRTGRGTLYWVVGAFGQVIDGIEVVKEAAKLKEVSEVQITECGVIVPSC
ncbi:E3 ubiquitin-protein ligase TRIM39-like [Macrobrachium nipponense]|uniref:E3 ubiquitin-protein ligase TRIM39-like n=1 Tax=Macrobrachium nipponense TaxID=159736 RepID=UPI0030C83FF9